MPPCGGSTGKQRARPGKNCLLPLTVPTMQAIMQSHSSALSTHPSLHSRKQMGQCLGCSQHMQRLTWGGLSLLRLAPLAAFLGRAQQLQRFAGDL